MLVYGKHFLQVFLPPLRLAIVGAVHISQALVPMAAIAGYEVTVIDPRQAWATEARFPGVNLITEWPDYALEAFQPDARTAVVTLTHDPKLDDPALVQALRSQAFYIGALGSTRTHSRRLERLRAEGLEETALARIHGPAGLAIGARSPAEIALAVLAQMTSVLRRVPPLVRGKETSWNSTTRRWRRRRAPSSRIRCASAPSTARKAGGSPPRTSTL